MIGKRRVISYSILTGSEFLSFYRSKMKKLTRSKYKRITDTATIQKCISEIFGVVADCISECDGGVNMNGLGYFGVWRSANPMVHMKNYSGIHMNVHSKGYQYFLDFFPDTQRNKATQLLRMDRMFNETLKSKVSNNLKSGKRYKNLYFLFKSAKKCKIRI